MRTLLGCVSFGKALLFMLGLILIPLAIFSKRVREYCWPTCQRCTPPNLMLSVTCAVAVVSMIYWFFSLVARARVDATSYFMADAASMLIMAVAALLVARIDTASYEAAFLRLGVGSFIRSHIRSAVLGCACMICAVALTGKALSWFEVHLPSGNGSVAQQDFSTPVVITRVLLSAGLGPLVEEVFFRGMLFGSLRPRLGFWGAATISSAIFAVAHGWSVAPQLFVSAWTLSWMYNRTGSIWPSAIAHAINNVSPLLFTRTPWSG